MLQGKLVRLRRPEPDDVDRVLRWINDTEVTQYLAARYPVSRAQETAWLERVSKQGPADGVVLAIETLAGSRHIGTISLDRVQPDDRHATLGIMIGEKDCWGAGYGTDAIVTLLRYAFDWMNLHRIDLKVWSENPRAIASYLKCGFVMEGRLRQDYYQRGAYHDILHMGILAGEFRALHGSSDPETAAC
jgi:RimJ/RimL family protein N-acetyltransferase